jgi:hypothetical protein
MSYLTGKMPSAKALKASSVGGFCGVPDANASPLKVRMPALTMAPLTAAVGMTSLKRCSNAASLSTDAMTSLRALSED